MWQLQSELSLPQSASIYKSIAIGYDQHLIAIHYGNRLIKFDALSNTTSYNVKLMPIWCCNNQSTNDSYSKLLHHSDQLILYHLFNDTIHSNIESDCTFDGYCVYQTDQEYHDWHNIKGTPQLSIFAMMIDHRLIVVDDDGIITNGHVYNNTYLIETESDPVCRSMGCAGIILSKQSQLILIGGRKGFRSNETDFISQLMRYNWKTMSSEFIYYSNFECAYHSAVLTADDEYIIIMGGETWVDGVDCVPSDLIYVIDIANNYSLHISTIKTPMPGPCSLTKTCGLYEDYEQIVCGFIRRQSIVIDIIIKMITAYICWESVHWFQNKHHWMIEVSVILASY